MPGLAEGDRAPLPLAPSARRRRFFYEIRDGDTLDVLAARFGTDRQTIALDNALDPTAGLRPGQHLTIRPPGEGNSPRSAP